MPVLLAALALAGCAGLAPYQPFDSEDHLRRLFAERLGPEGEQVEIPFALDETMVAFAEQRLARGGGEPWQVEQLLDVIFNQLGLEYRLAPTRTAVETWRSRSGNCLSFVNLFVGLARHQRLNPFYVEVRDHQRWNYREGTVISHGHIVAGLYVQGKLRTYDFLPYRSKSYRDFRPIDELTATAHFYNNLGAEALLDGDAERAYPLLRIAAGLAPEFAKAQNNLGVSLQRMGRLEEARELLEAAAATHPDEVALLTNLARTYQQLGRSGEALQVLARLETVENANPFLFVYRGHLALGEGKYEEALSYMVEALRRDTEAPEVHLGLVKVYLALGQLDKARHHVARAIRLDATHAEALRYAELLAGMEGGAPAPRPH